MHTATLFGVEILFLALGLIMGLAIEANGRPKGLLKPEFVRAHDYSKRSPRKRPSATWSCLARRMSACGSSW